LTWKQERIAARRGESIPRLTAVEPIQLGLRANWRQFALLVVINAFVGGVVGVERSTLAPLAQHDFQVASRTAILSFLVSFGLVKAGSNLAAGWLADRLGRRTVLLAGWLAAVPVAPLIILAPSWTWVVGANVLLGVNQGLAWSMTVNMKVDLVGPARRGFALGLNEAAGYVAVSVAAAAAGFLAASFGLRPAPYLLAEALAVAGLLLSLLTRETARHVELESAGDHEPMSLRATLLGVSFRDRSMSSACQAGMVNNLNDGMAWALLPLFFAARGLDLRQIAILAGVYPAVWGVGQLGTGWISDHVGRKILIVTGMLLQALAIGGFVLLGGFKAWLVAAVMLGAGTAMVYPTLLAVIGDVAPPVDRATSLGVYRTWRDSGYAVGAVVAGVVADTAGFPAAIAAVAALTGLSGVVAWIRMPTDLELNGRGPGVQNIVVNRPGFLGDSGVPRGRSPENL
jgi:MFS family permease